MGITFMNTENSKTNESHKFALTLSQRLDLRRSDKHFALQNLSIYYTWKNIRNQYENNKLKIIAPTWNDEIELRDSFYSVSDIQDYIEFIMKENETLTTISPIHVYINIINNRSVFKIKDGYRTELQRPETMTLFGSTRKLIEKTKAEKIIELIEVVLVQCNFVVNRYQQKSEVLYTFTYLLIVF